MITHYFHTSFSAKNVLLVTPRRTWPDTDGIVVDTFDGAFDSLLLFAQTPFHLSQFDVWPVDECDFMAPTQWHRLADLFRMCEPVLLVLADDPGRLSPMEDDNGTAANRISCDTVVLTQQLRFDANSPWGGACRAVRRKPTDRELDALVGPRVLGAAQSTVAAMQTSHDVYPQGLSVSITIRGVRLLNDLAVEALMTNDHFMENIHVDADGDTRRIPMHVGSRFGSPAI